MYPKDSLQGLMGKHNLQLILQSVAQSHDVAKSKVSLHLTSHNIHALCMLFRVLVLLSPFVRTVTTGTA